MKRKRKKEPKLLTASPRYREFIKGRDLALEQFHLRAQINISQHLANAIESLLPVIFRSYSSIAKDHFFTAYSQNVLAQLSDVINRKLVVELADPIYGELLRLRRNSYILSYLGQSEAINRAMGTEKPTGLNREKIDKALLKNDDRDRHMLSSIVLALKKQAKSLSHAIDQAHVLQETPDEMMLRVKKGLPKLKKAKRPGRTIKSKPREAAGPKPMASFSFLDPQEIQDMIQDYKSALPKLRFDDKEFDVPVQGQEETEIYYGWEIENQVTHDFVRSVRSGEDESAKAAGINEFVWIALFQKTTCECCIARDGLLTSEIEEKIASGELDEGEDGNSGSVPPLHQNCYCRLAPASDDIPDSPPSRIGDFEEWLEKR